jgi:hypothetical protein
MKQIDGHISWMATFVIMNHRFPTRMEMHGGVNDGRVLRAIMLAAHLNYNKFHH